MAWNRHAIAQTQLRKHVASMAWGARNLISTQVSTTSNKNGAFTLNLFQTHRLNPQSQCHANNTPQARNNGHAAFAATLS